MTPKKLVSALAAIGFGVGLTLSAGPANAVISIFSPITAYQDDNIDFVVDNNNNGVIDAGDRILSVFEMVNTQGVLGGQGPNAIAPEELTGVADITVFTTLGDGTLVFIPSGAAGVLSGFAAGTMVALWTDATADLNVINAACGTQAACLLAAGLGAGDPLYLTAGFFGDDDESWTSLPVSGGATIATRGKWGFEHYLRWLQLRADRRHQQYRRGSRTAAVRAVLRSRWGRFYADHGFRQHPRRSIPRP
jgi:hypothetical protein